MTSIAIVEDKPGLAANLRRIVERSPGFTCGGAWGSGEEALEKASAFGADIVLMDINLPGISGIETTAMLKRQMPDLRVIMVTVYRDHDMIFDALKAGACGYLLKRFTATEIREAIIEVRDGGAPMTPEIARRVVEAFHGSAPAEEGTHLTKREAQILDLLAQGLANKEIAARLEVSPQTVHAHLLRVYDKLHVRSRTEALVKYRDGSWCART